MGGMFKVYALPYLSKPVYVAEGLSHIPTYLSPDYVVRRSTAKAALIEILVADLGDSTSTSPFLIVSLYNLPELTNAI
jgi:cleavage and polyadenylation specificity factor subunit 1